MQFIHAREFLSDGQAVRIVCDTQCNVMLLDDNNFSSYRSGARFSYVGGFYRRFPAVLRPPHSGHWNAVLDLAGGRASIRYSITVVG